MDWYRPVLGNGGAFLIVDQQLIRLSSWLRLWICQIGIVFYLYQLGVFISQRLVTVPKWNFLQRILCSVIGKNEELLPKFRVLLHCYPGFSSDSGSDSWPTPIPVLFLILGTRVRISLEPGAGDGARTGATLPRLRNYGCKGISIEKLWRILRKGTASLSL